MPQRIAVIGNSCAGKTTLSRRLARIHELPLFHVDSIQFIDGMKIRPHLESISILEKIHSENSWIIDGYGPLDILEKRFEICDRIVFLDFPLWQHYWWALKRVLKSPWSPRQELPPNCNDFNWQQISKLFRTIWKVHYKMRPQIIKIIGRPANHKKAIFICSMADWKSIYEKGIPNTERS